MKKTILFLAFFWAFNSFAQKPKVFQDLDSGLWGLKNQTGQIILNPIYEVIGEFRSGFTQINLNSKQGLINDLGKVIIEPTKYDKIDNFYDNGFAKVTLNNKEGLINKLGIEVIAPQYDMLRLSSPFGANLHYFSVKNNDKFGTVDKTGKVVVELKYDKFDYYHKSHLGLFGMYQDGNPNTIKYGLVNSNGTAFTPTKYDEISSFNLDLAKVKVDGKSGYINDKGIEIIPAKYDFIQSFNGDNFTNCVLNGKHGIVNRNGKEVIPPIYDEIEKYENGKLKYKAVRNGTNGEVNLQGVETVSFE